MAGAIHDAVRAAAQRVVYYHLVVVDGGSMATLESVLLPGGAALAVAGSLAHGGGEGGSVEAKAREFQVQPLS